MIMLQAFVTRVKLSLRRISFICGTCIILATSCENIPDQDACIEIDASDNDEMVLTVDTTIAYDTIASTLECIVRYKDGTFADNWKVSWFIDSTDVKKQTDRAGRTGPVWVQAGTYAVTIGNPNEYPCISIRNLRLRGGIGCELKVTLPTNE